MGSVTAGFVYVPRLSAPFLCSNVDILCRCTYARTDTDHHCLFTHRTDTSLKNEKYSNDDEEEMDFLMNS